MRESFTARGAGLVLATLLVSAPASSQVRHTTTTIVESAAADGTAFKVTVTHISTDGICCATDLSVWTAPGGRYRQTPTATFHRDGEIAYDVVRRAADGVVLSTMDPHGNYGENERLFFDPQTGAFLRRIPFSRTRDLEFRDDTDASRVLGVSVDALKVLRRAEMLPGPVEIDPKAFAEGLAERGLRERVARYGLKQSTRTQLAAERKDLLEPPYTPADFTIEEEVGAVQLHRGLAWFGKTFYGGEGMTGIGDIGYLDAGNRLTMLHVKEAARWAIDAMLVEDDTVWAGLRHRGEYGSRSGGLLEYLRATKTVRVHDVPDEILRIVRAGDALFVKTDHGLYRLRDGHLTRFRAEPGVDGHDTVLVTPLD